MFSSRIQFNLFFCIALLLFWGFQSFSQCTPVLDLPFSGNSLDVSGNNNFGIPSGTPTLTSDRFGNPNSAYEFGGVGDVDYFTVTNNPTIQFTNQLTMSYWFKQCSFQGMNGNGQTVPYGYHIIMAKLGDGFAAQPGIWNGLSVDPATNQLNWGICNKNGYQVTPNFCVNSTFNCINFCEWVHVVVVFNNTNCKVYFNGQLVVNQTIDQVDFSVSNTKNLLIGKMDGIWYPYRGTIDDIKIYNCAINEATVADLFGGFSDPNNNNVTPTFSQIAPICPRQSFTLPTTSQNGIPGTWSPAINNQQTTTYIFTPAAGQCANATQMTVQVGSPVTPTFTQLGPFNAGSNFTLPTTSNNGISGTWSPAINNQQTTIYTFTPSAGACATNTSMTVVIETQNNCNPNGWTAYFNYLNQPLHYIPFQQVLNPQTGTAYLPPNLANTGFYWSKLKYEPPTPLCVPDHFSIEFKLHSNLPSGISAFDTEININSDGGDSGVRLMGEAWGQPWTDLWVNGQSLLPNSPLLIFPSILTWSTIRLEFNSGVLNYYVNNNLFFTTNYSGNLCNINWFDIRFKGSGSVDYVKIFDGQNNELYSEEFNDCNNMSVFPNLCNQTVNLSLSSTAPTCSNPILQLNASVSPNNNNLTYQWTGPNGFSSNLQNPSISNPTSAANGTYTCTVLGNPCNPLSTQTIQITNAIIPPTITPTFTQVQPICAGANLSTLPTTSNNGITGTWSPAVNNQQTTTYTFTPSSGQCANSATMTITVNPMINPTFTQVQPICAGANLSALPTTSNNGITGTWSPALNNQQTTTYTFTPSAGQCANPATMTITVNPNFVSYDTIVMCENELPFFWNNQLLLVSSNPIALLQSVHGCDSIAHLNFQVIPIQHTSINHTICTNELPFQWDGDDYYLTNSYTKTYSNQLGCDSVVTLHLTVYESSPANFSVLPWSGCLPLELTFVNENIEENSTFLWNFGNGNTSNNIFGTSVVYNEQGCYDISLSLTNQNGCTTTHIWQDSICFYPNPVASFWASSTSISELNPTIYIENTSANYTNWTWRFGNGESDSTQNSLIYSYDSGQGEYDLQLIVENENGCQDSVMRIIRIFKEEYIYIPNSFTPNGNGANEVFNPVIADPQDIGDYKLLIFNRWGELIFESHHYAKGWNGEYNGAICPDGSYMYAVHVKYTNKAEPVNIHGHVTLMR